MTITVVRYRIRPGLEDENARLVRDVYRELHATVPPDVAYSTLLLEDGTFLHVAELEDPTALRRVEAFTTFRDGLDVVARAGVTAVIQPGGSLRDEEVITAADEHGLAMVLTGIRHFRH